MSNQSNLYVWVWKPEKAYKRSVYAIEVIFELEHDGVGYLGFFWLNAKILLLYTNGVCIYVYYYIDETLISISFLGQNNDKRTGVTYQIRQNLYEMDCIEN